MDMRLGAISWQWNDENHGHMKEIIKTDMRGNGDMRKNERDEEREMKG